MSTREPAPSTDPPSRGEQPGARPMVERTDPPSIRRDPEGLRQEIDDTREEMGETVEALAQKTDIKARISGKIGERTAGLRDRRDSAKARATELRQRAAGATPDDAKRAMTQVARTAEQRPGPAIGMAVAAGFVLGLLVGRR
jgi:ElaB/YqjD/DUF883 family membrane-anchored ribosome-binding protein